MLQALNISDLWDLRNNHSTKGNVIYSNEYRYMHLGHYVYYLCFRSTRVRYNPRNTHQKAWFLAHPAEGPMSFCHGTVSDVRASTIRENRYLS